MFARKTSPSKTMECWFCTGCGTRLFHVPGGAAYPNRNVKPGTLDDTSWLVPTIHFWTRSAQEWVVIPEDATHIGPAVESGLMAGREILGTGEYRKDAISVFSLTAFVLGLMRRANRRHVATT
jgi:hypothetical protein